MAAHFCVRGCIHGSVSFRVKETQVSGLVTLLNCVRGKLLSFHKMAVSGDCENKMNINTISHKYYLLLPLVILA